MRKIAGWIAVAAAIPYLVLKALWVAGVGIGVNDQALMDSSGMVAANAVTGLLEVVGVVVALAFLMPWGMRVPSWLVLFLMWVGTGLLAPIAVMTPIALTAELLSPDAVSSSQALAAWVPWVVYAGFTVQAIALFTAFFFYAKQRWGNVLRGAVAEVPAGPTHRLQRLLALVAGGLAVGGAVPAVAGLASSSTLNEVLQRGAFIALAALVVTGLLMLMRALPAPAMRAAALTWVGSAGLFATGALMLLLSVGTPTEPLDAHTVIQMLAGTLAGALAAFAMAERDWETRVA
jgi:hypothetical protein